MAQILAYTETFLPNCRSFSTQSTRVLSKCRNISMWGTKSPACNITTLCDRYTPRFNIKRFTYAMANSNIYSTFFLGATAHLTINAIIKITWENDEPSWTEQWPPTKEKLEATKELITEPFSQKYLQSLPIMKKLKRGSCQGTFNFKGSNMLHFLPLCAISQGLFVPYQFLEYRNE